MTFINYNLDESKTSHTKNFRMKFSSSKFISIEYDKKNFCSTENSNKSL